MRFSPRVALPCATFVRRVAESILLPMLLLVAVCPFANAAEYLQAPAPAWANAVTWTHADAPPPAQVSDGAYYLLADYQTRIDDDGASRYRHFAVKALSETGVDSIANLEIGFDPSYETLTIHSVAVIRDGRRVSRLESADVRVLQREKDLEYRVLDGSKTAHLFLDDIRVGDIIEYSYTVHGSNPVFAKRTFGELPLQWSVPVQHLFARLLLPSARAVAVSTWNTSLPARQRNIDGLREYVWEQSDTAPVPNDDDSPGWFNPYPAARWSEFADWSAVARWATPLYAPRALGPDLRAQVLRIKNEQSDPAQRLLAALRLVQSDVRYLGVEIGAGSYSPNAPDLVFRRRFGDCKDKTLLLLSLLHSLDIDARPALVNSTVQRGLKDVVPNPGAFDHVIVQARVRGKNYWLDPTRSVQLSRLDTLFQPDFGYALLVEPGTRGLTEMKSENLSGKNRAVLTEIDARGGYDKPAIYTVHTTLRGEQAEQLRNTLASDNREDLQRKYLNFYAGYYTGIRVAAPMTVEDDIDGNQLTTVERYEIPNFWPYLKEKKRRQADIFVPDMQTYLTPPGSTVRHSPIGLNFPLEFNEETDVLLPDTWTITPETTHVDTSQFAFKRTISGAGARWQLIDSFRTLADNVPPDAVPAYAADLNRAREALGYYFYVNDDPGELPFWDRFNWMVAMLAVMVLVIFAWVARRLYRYDPKPYPAPGIASVSGFGGWLILPAIGVVLAPLTMLSAINNGLAAFAMPTWISHTHLGGAQYHASWAPLLLFEISAQLGYFVLSVLLAILFFQRRRCAPVLFIALTLYLVIYETVDLAGLHILPNRQVVLEDWRELFGACVRAAVWCPYFLLSRRVKATFTQTWRALPPPPPAIGTAAAETDGNIGDPATCRQSQHALPEAVSDAGCLPNSV